MLRHEQLQKIEDPETLWDMIIIGGGATGLGSAVDAAARGYRTLLLEQLDFASGTSSRSTKLIHGGVRYLQQGNLTLVQESLRERGLLMRNAPHLVHNCAFIVPLYEWWERLFYGAGLKLYDLLAGNQGLGPSRRLTREETVQRIPNLAQKGLTGGIIYYDGQFDDSRLAVCLARTLEGLGGVALNYLKVTAIEKSDGLTTGVIAQDMESGREYSLRARSVINATGVYCDGIRRLDDPASDSIITPSQGIHLVLERSFLGGECAIMVPHTDDSRVLFALPWYGRVLLGTTDTPVTTISAEPRPLAEEIRFLLIHAGRYLTRQPGKRDILSVFAGLRPLVRNKRQGKTASLPRDHIICVSSSGLITVSGGKWTTYRQMAEAAIDQAEKVAGLTSRPSNTEQLHLYGWQEDRDGVWGGYGADGERLVQLAGQIPDGHELLHPRLPYLVCQVIWGVRHESARTVEDMLARRTRALLLDARAAMEAAPLVARLMAGELGSDENWQKQQVRDFLSLARGYLPG